MPVIAVPRRFAVVKPTTGSDSSCIAAPLHVGAGECRFPRKILRLKRSGPGSLMRRTGAGDKDLPGSRFSSVPVVLKSTYKGSVLRLRLKLKAMKIKARRARTIEMIAHPDRMADMRRRARETVVERYSLTKCVPAQLKLIEDQIAGRRSDAD